MRVIPAYRFALDPTPAQERALRSHCGAQRFAYNWGLARVTANLAQRAAERSYGIPEQELTPPAGWSAWALRKEFNAVKDRVAPWWAENSKEAYASGLANLANALGNWKAGRDGTRKGPKARFPVFRGKQATQSVRFSTGSFGLAEEDRRHVRLPRIGLAEDLNVAGMLRNRRLARQIADAGFGLLRRQLAYKTAWHGGRLVTAGRFYPSSKTCSGCGAVKAKLRLAERTYRCPSCGLVIGRDLNAARNLAALAGGASSPSRGATVNEPAGNPGKTRPAGTGYRHGKTAPGTGDGQRPRRKARAA